VAALEQTISALNRIRGVARTRTTVVLSTRFEDRVRPAARPADAAAGPSEER
jgi:Lrp/AsnC family leucine-responsive transcriptional regulator